MRRVAIGLAGVAITLVLTLPASAEEAEVREFQGWASWREGASTTMKNEGMAGGMKMTLTVKAVLKKVLADKVVLEVATVTEMGGQKFALPATPVEIPARAPKLPVKEESKGRESITVNGKAFA